MYGELPTCLQQVANCVAMQCRYGRLSGMPGSHPLAGGEQAFAFKTDISQFETDISQFETDNSQFETDISQFETDIS